VSPALVGGLASAAPLKKSTRRHPALNSAAQPNKKTFHQKVVDLAARAWHYAPEAFRVENFLVRPALFFSSIQ
jgi:hypothetical protein